MTRMQAHGQSDFDKMRRLPWLYLFTVMTGTATLCTVTAPLTLFAAELGLDEGRIGLLSGIMPFFQALGILSLPIVLRFGSRSVATTALTLRYVFLCLFLIVPFFAARPDTVFGILMAAMLGFAVCRSVAEAAISPWSQEFMPRSVRGRISGRMALAYVPVALGVSWAIQAWLDGRTGLDRFIPVFAVGIVIGIAGSLTLLGLRGGSAADTSAPRRRSLTEPLRDRNFVIYLFASALQSVVFVSISLFLILFFRDRLGMSSGALVLLVALIPVGAAAGNVTAGWFVDRYGTRAIRTALQTGQIGLLLALPLLGPEIPAVGALVPLAFFLFGFLFQAGIAVGTVYMLNVIPPASKEEYAALHYSTDGLAGGLATFAAGFLLAWIGVREVSVLGVDFGKYEALFLVAAGLTSVSALAYSRLHEEGALSVRDFVGHFTTGNPMKALWGINRYASRTSEDRRRELAFRFGGVGSLLAKEELIAALRDPSFDVRHEAIRALGHIGAHPAVLSALETVLGYDGLVELRYAALGSLGRLKATTSAPRVAEFMEDPNPLLRARAARSLGEIGDMSSLPRIRTMLLNDPDLDCRLAATSALGKLKDRSSMPALIDLYLEQAADRLCRVSEPRSKVVLLAITKIFRCEEEFSHQWRREEIQSGLAMPQMLLQLARRVRTGCPQASAKLRELASDYDGEDAEATLAALSDLSPALHQSRHPDSGLAVDVLKAVRTAADPHPALLVAMTAILNKIFAA